MREGGREKGREGVREGRKYRGGERVGVRGERGREVREKEEGDREDGRAGNIEENTISRAQPTTPFDSQKVALQSSALSSLPSGQSGMPSHTLELSRVQPTPEGQVTWIRRGEEGAEGTGTEGKAGTLSDSSQPLGLLLGGWIVMQHEHCTQIAAREGREEYVLAWDACAAARSARFVLCHAYPSYKLSLFSCSLNRLICGAPTSP